MEWNKGKYEAVISEDLFKRCQQIRAAKAVHHEYYPKYFFIRRVIPLFRTYLLRDLIFCADCVANMPDGETDKNYDKMRPQAQNDRPEAHLYYRCRARDFGRVCPQRAVRADTIEQQVIHILKTLKPPADWWNKMVEAMGQLIGDQRFEERIAEIKRIIDRMDFRGDQGVITNRDEYLEQRVKSQQELEQITPIPDDELQQQQTF